MNVARQETVRSNTADKLWALLQSWRPIYVDSIVGDMQVIPANPDSSWRNRFLSNEAGLRRIRAADGTISPEVRKWRFNAVSRYSFDRGPLKDWSFGGAVRWQDKSAIGYPVMVVDDIAQYDVTRPYFGPTETNFDAWIGYTRKFERFRWRSQFNVRNIGKKNELIPVHAQPDGTVHSHRIGADMTWTFSNTIEF
jgi:hypothetical protein